MSCWTSSATIAIRCSLTGMQDPPAHRTLRLSTYSKHHIELVCPDMQGSSTQLLAPLKEVLESMTSGYEVMKEVVAALQDTERGKTASMTVLLQQGQERYAAKPSREEHERLRLEVSTARQTGVLHLQPVSKSAQI